MAVKVSIINNEKFTVNGKTVYRKDGQWHAKPHLTSNVEFPAALEIIRAIKQGTTATAQAVINVQQIATA